MRLVVGHCAAAGEVSAALISPIDERSHATAKLMLSISNDVL
jgi:hypothetical protein